MQYRKLNITIKLEDSDAIQWKLEEALKGLIGEQNITDLRVLPNTSHLDNDDNYKALWKAEKKAKNLKYDYIKNNRK